ncbi:Hypothetical predicted protein [Cloeon dipterum]|uniref:Retinoid-inducible serine carboxypeptidase n=1 Tax=Cloeon dipterum TaxID=197152 RepID=A0A8S1C7P3_9INSE|nr:Hypothetical predicted protein [Cloeon dipterum]
MKTNSVVTVILGLLLASSAECVPLKNTTLRPGSEDWGYMDVRPGAHMFYWLFTSTAAEDPATLPIIIWLQGGPGAGSTGYGNFKGMGPLDIDLKPRNNSWVHHANVIFLDNPVGAGYSYVDNDEDLATNATGIALDLVSFMKLFYEKYPQFVKTPVYCFSQSYGGKMAAFFGVEMDKAMKAGEIVGNFKGVALGSAWISPIDSTTSWAPYLLQVGILDTRRHNIINKYAAKCRDLVDNKEWTRATQCWSNTEVLISIYGHNIDFYNILKKTSPSDLNEDDLKTFSNNPLARTIQFALRTTNTQSLTDLMNGKIFDKLSATLTYLSTWNSQSAKVFKANWADFMQPAVGAVETLLEDSELTVAVDNGQLDLICNTPAQLIWAEKMNWSNLSDWINAPRDAITVHDYTEGYVKRFGRFSFWWINRAGHSVPYDNPEGAIAMMRNIVGLPDQEHVEFYKELSTKTENIIKEYIENETN